MSATSAAGAACDGSWMSVRIGTPSRALIAAEHAQALVEAGPAERAARRAVGLVVRRLEDERDADSRRGDVDAAVPASSMACASLSMTHGPGDEHERAAAAERESPSWTGSRCSLYGQAADGPDAL